MKLICHPISPYARKAMILARLHRIEVEEIQPEKNGARSNGSQDNIFSIARLSVNIWIVWDRIKFSPLKATHDI